MSQVASLPTIQSGIINNHESKKYILDVHPYCLTWFWIIGPNINNKLPKPDRWSGDRGVNVGPTAPVGGVGASSNDVIPGGCHHYASGALKRCTDRQTAAHEYINVTKGKTTRNSIYSVHSSNIGNRVDVKLIKNCTTKQHVETKTSAFGLKMKHIRQHSWACTGLRRKQPNAASLNQRARSINRWINKVKTNLVAIYTHIRAAPSKRNTNTLQLDVLPEWGN